MELWNLGKPCVTKGYSSQGSMYDGAADAAPLCVFLRTFMVVLFSCSVLSFQCFQFFRRRNVNHTDSIVVNINLLDAFASGLVRRMHLNALDELIEDGGR